MVEIKAPKIESKRGIWDVLLPDKEKQFYDWENQRLIIMSLRCTMWGEK